MFACDIPFYILGRRMVLSVTKIYVSGTVHIVTIVSEPVKKAYKVDE